MSRKPLIIILSTFCLLTFNAQNRKADSLRAIIKVQKEDTNLVRSLIALADYMENREVKESMQLAKRALELSTKLNYREGKLRSKLWYARALTNTGDTANARSEFEKLKKLMGNDVSEEMISDFHYGLGSFYEKQNNFEKAVENYTVTIEIRKRSLEILEKTGNKEAIKQMKTSLGYAYLNLGDVNESFAKSGDAIISYKRAIELLKDGNVRSYLSVALNNIGLSFLNIGDYKTALKHHFEALKVKVEINDSAGIANTHHNIGNVYFNTGDFKAALKNYNIALEIDLGINDVKRTTMLYSNIGVVYEFMGDMEKALASYKLSLEQAEKSNDDVGLSSCYINLANVLIKQGDDFTKEKKIKEASEKYNLALQSQIKAEKIYEKGADDQALAILFINMGGLSQRLKKFDKARDYFNKSIELSGQGDHIRELSYAYGNLSELDSVVGDYKGALRNYKRYILLRDSMINEESSKKIVELQMQSDFDKKETEVRLIQEKKDEITQKEINHQKQQRNLSLLGVALFAIMAIFIFRSYKQKQKANELLEEKNELIASQKYLVEEKNKEITDSINYAKRLQSAILASEKTMRDVFDQSFILFKPKDIVSGDFYWILHIEDKAIKKNIFAFAAADCTGHGVPGAFMSMLNSTLLNQTAYNPDINTPADALNFLNQELPKNLRSPDDTENIQDGMDIAFCLVDLNKNILKYSGANNPCWIIRDNELMELKPVKQAITASTEYEKKKFVDQIMPLKRDDCIYIFTDGYADQFGGPKGRKFMYKTLSSLLINIHKEPFDKQREILDQRFMEWKGELEQVDDVLLMGIKIT